MQVDLGFELELMAVCATLENTVLPGIWISVKEQQKLFVQKPECKPEKKTILNFSHTPASSVQQKHHQWYMKVSEPIQAAYSKR